MLYAAVFTFPGELNEAQCALRPWLVGVGVMLLMGPMIAKLYRLFRIIENTSLVQVLCMCACLCVIKFVRMSWLVGVGVMLQMGPMIAKLPIVPHYREYRVCMSGNECVLNQRGCVRACACMRSLVNANKLVCASSNFAFEYNTFVRAPDPPCFFSPLLDRH